MFTVLVCGGRHYKDADHVDEVLTRIVPLFATPKEILLVDGACHLGGADQLAHNWASRYRLMTKRYPVDVRIDGPWPAAGVNRNKRMYDDAQPDLVIGFPGGNGTRNMINYALKMNCKNILILK
jgi:hypothetical protein